MRQAWRWFGPNDPVSLDDIRQAGASDVVTALHDIPIGDVWSVPAITERQALIEGGDGGKSALRWSVVESVAVHDHIKRGADGWQAYAENFAQTLRHLGQCGIHTVCYNFMPVIDWTRTDLRFDLPNGAKALRFDADEFAMFDLYLLKRDGAPGEYDSSATARAKAKFDEFPQSRRDRLCETIMAGLPGGMSGSHGIEEFRSALAAYQDISDDELRQNLYNFLDYVLPVAEQAGVNLAIHPDDPPCRLLGMPRVVCTADDVAGLFQRLPSPANGLTLCAGTFGAHVDNDLPAMAKQFGSRIHFTHLRGTRRDVDNPLSFIEAEHLDSDIDMIAVIRNLLAEEKARYTQGKAHEIIMRPDHGHLMLDDLRKEKINPGYSAIGRLKGLAEIRGVLRTLAALE